MNWDAIGAIGEVLGAIAVFVTLAYLAVQVRHARHEAQRALSQGRGEGIRELLAFGADERINRLMVKGDTALGSSLSPISSALIEQVGLTREEAIAVVLYQISWWNYTVQIIPNIEELPEIERRQFDLSIVGRYARSGVGRLFFESQKTTAHPHAVRYVENVLAQQA